VLNWNGKKVGEGEMEKSATEGAEWREAREQQVGKREQAAFKRCKRGKLPGEGRRI